MRLILSNIMTAKTPHLQSALFLDRDGIIVKPILGEAPTTIVNLKLFVFA